MNVLLRAARCYAFARAADVDAKYKPLALSMLKGFEQDNRQAVFTGKDDEFVALTAFFISMLVERNYAIPETLVTATKAELLQRAGFNPSASPSGQGIAFMKNWLKWFPVIVSTAKGLNIALPADAKLKTMLELTLTSNIRTPVAVPDIVFSLAWKKLIAGKRVDEKAAAKALQQIANGISLFTNNKGEAKGILAMTFGGRTAEVYFRICY